MTFLSPPLYLKQSPGSVRRPKKLENDVTSPKKCVITDYAKGNNTKLDREGEKCKRGLPPGDLHTC